MAGSNIETAELEHSEWMEQRKSREATRLPLSIYEVHLGSWRRVPHEGNRSLIYRELAPMLADWVNEMDSPTSDCCL